MWETELTLHPGGAPLATGASRSLRVCPHCQRSFDVESDYCNYCKVDLTDTDLVSLDAADIFARASARVSFIYLGLTALAALMGLVGILISLSGNAWSIPLLVAGSYGSRYFYGKRVAHERRAAQERQVDATELLAMDARAPVLYLRRFLRDATRHASPWVLWTYRMFSLPTRQELISFEEELVCDLFRLGPVVALRNPASAVSEPLVGAARLAAIDNWQDAVTTIRTRARVLVLTLDDSPPLRWELETVLADTARYRLILTPLIHAFRAQRQYRDQYEMLRAAFSSLPPFDPRLVAIRFEPESETGQPLLGKTNYPDGSERIQIVSTTVADWLFFGEWRSPSGLNAGCADA